MSLTIEERKRGEHILDSMKAYAKMRWPVPPLKNEDLKIIHYVL